MKIELQKVECDWPQSSLGCYISLNNCLVDVITPINNPHAINTVELKKSGVLRLVIRDMGRPDGYLGSVSVSLSLLNCSTSTITLPLFDSPNGDTINSISEVFESPNLTLSYFNNYSDEEIILTTTESKSNLKTDSMLDPQSSFNSENTDLSIKSSKKISYEENKIEGLEIFQEEIENLRDELSKEKEKTKSTNEKIQDLMRNFKQASIRSQTRESSLLELISEKEEQLSKNLEINLNLQNKLRTLSLENNLLQSQVEKYKKQEEYIFQLENELKRHQELLKSSEKAKFDLTSTLIQLSNSDFPDLPVSTPTPKKSSFMSSTTKILSENTSARSPSQSCQSRIRSQILKSLPKSMTPGKVHKIKDSLYSVNNLHLNLAIDQSGIYVKTESRLVPLEKYLKYQNSKPSPPDENCAKHSKSQLKPATCLQNRLKTQSKGSSRSTQSLSHKKP